MIVLNNDTRSLEVDLSGAITTNQLQYVVHYNNTTPDRLTTSNSTNGLTNNTTAVTMLAAPVPGGKREIMSLTIYNADTVNATVTVQINDNSTLRTLVVTTLNSQDTLIYTSSSGFFVLTSDGSIKSTASAVSLNDLSDVVITTPATGAVLKYDGTDWIDGQVDLADTDAVTGTLAIANGGTNAATAAAARTNLGVGITLGTEVASTSGTAIDFTGIPAGVRRIKVMFVGVSTSGTSDILIQVGDPGGFEITGYTSTSDNGGATQASSTAGFICTNNIAATDTATSTMTLELENNMAFTWMMHGIWRRANTAVLISAGSKSLSAELTQIRITTVNGTDTFDAGAINISYES